MGNDMDLLCDALPVGSDNDTLCDADLDTECVTLFEKLALPVGSDNETEWLADPVGRDNDTDTDRDSVPDFVSLNDALPVGSDNDTLRDTDKLPDRLSVLDRLKDIDPLAVGSDNDTLPLLDILPLSLNEALNDIDLDFDLDSDKLCDTDIDNDTVLVSTASPPCNILTTHRQSTTEHRGGKKREGDARFVHIPPEDVHQSSRTAIQTPRDIGGMVKLLIPLQYDA